MVKALGYSTTDFDPLRPGRLCRGRERWIEPWPPLTPDDYEQGARREPEPQPIHRLVISGATFADDSARDALRGVVHSGIDLPALLGALFPGRRLLAFMEDGHPADIPDGAEGIEAYEGYRAGGMSQIGMVRWHKVVDGPEEIRLVLGDPGDERVRGFAALEQDTDVARLAEALFLLVGMSTLDSPPARFQPMALPAVLQLVPAVAVLHRDKHGPALGVYSRDPLPLDGRLEPLCAREGALLVPFAIPPMLARWDRALAELRAGWSATRTEDFPVPPSLEPDMGWQGRRRGRRNRRDDRERQRTEQAAEE